MRLSLIHISWASEKEAIYEYGVVLHSIDDAKNADCIIVAVAHNEFKEISLEAIKKLFRKGEDEKKVLLDVKGTFNIEELKESGIRYWRL